MTVDDSTEGLRVQHYTVLCGHLQWWNGQNHRRSLVRIMAVAPAIYFLGIGCAVVSDIQCSVQPYHLLGGRGLYDVIHILILQISRKVV